MQFLIEELRIFWPFPYIYPEQYHFMCHMKRLLDKQGVGTTGLLEMPCGTGKTMSILSLVVSYQLHHGDGFGKLFYLSRTVPEMEAALGELKRLMAYVKEALAGQDGIVSQRAAEFLGVGLSSRAQLCVNAEVNVLGERQDVDGACRALQREWGGAGCGLRDATTGREVVAGVVTMGELRERAAREGFCSYYAARAMLQRARVVVFSYQYVLHGKILEVRRGVCCFLSCLLILCVSGSNQALYRAALGGGV